MVRHLILLCSIEKFFTVKVSFFFFIYFVNNIHVIKSWILSLTIAWQCLQAWECPITLKVMNDPVSTVDGQASDISNVTSQKCLSRLNIQVCRALYHAAAVSQLSCIPANHPLAGVWTYSYWGLAAWPRHKPTHWSYPDLQATGGHLPNNGQIASIQNQDSAHSIQSSTKSDPTFRHSFLLCTYQCYHTKPGALLSTL